MDYFGGKRKLHLMIGLPRSGKSTIAVILGFPIVCPDAIRLTIHGTPFRKEAEGLVWSIAKIMVEALFNAGHTDVIVDATNLTVKQREQWLSDKWEIKYHVIEIDKNICIERAKATGQDYLIDVIEKMATEMDISDIPGYNDEETDKTNYYLFK